MSIAVDLKMRQVLDSHITKLGTGDGYLNDLDLTPVGLTGLTTAPLQITGEAILGVDKEASRTWIEGALVKNPQEIITASECGLSHKKNLYVVFVKTPKEQGLYFNEAVSALVESHFPNNQKLKQNDFLVTVLKTFQQPTIYLDNDTGRYWNRIYVQCETYFKNNK